jgi:hypothetical protein
MKFLTQILCTCFVALVLPTSAFAEVSTLYFCDLSTSGSIYDEAFDGSFTDHEDGFFLFDWTHSYMGNEFEAVTPHPHSWCRLNGTISAEFEGTGTYNGIPGYFYSIRVEDNRDAPDRIVLTASITTSPTRRGEGTATFSAPTPVVIPYEIPVTVGASGPGWTRLHLDEVITCRYRGAGPSYVFERCTSPSGEDYEAGDSIDVSALRLRVQTADHAYDLTTVEADLGVIHDDPTTAPDRYYIGLFDTNGILFHEISGAIFDGDVSITLLGPKPPPLP